MNTSGQSAASKRPFPGAWQAGFHPSAGGAVVRSLTRVELPLGEALRLEMDGAAPGDVVHVQYYIATDAGAWALWISCAPGELAAHEARLAEIMPPDESVPDD
jgi:hypothetical protein